MQDGLIYGVIRGIPVWLSTPGFLPRSTVVRDECNQQDVAIYVLKQVFAYPGMVLAQVPRSSST